jgi:hypothetical protein
VIGRSAGIAALALPVGGRQIGQLLGAASGRSDRVTCVERSSDQFRGPTLATTL